MNKLLLSLGVSLLLQANTTSAQLVYTYQFDSNMHTTGVSVGPDLIPNCTPTYTMTTFPALGGIIHPTCHFGYECGFIFNDAAGFIAAGSYSIEMYVEMDTTASWRKLVDYMNLTDDNGLYNDAGALVFKGPGSVSGSYFTDGTYSLITITRDAISQKVRMFANGQYVDGFVDNGVAVAKYDANKKIRLLQDDTYSTGTESTSGNIALLKIYNYALDSATAIAHNSAIGLFFAPLDVNEQQTLLPNIDLSPIPADGYISATSYNSKSSDYIITDMTGKNILTGKLLPGTNQIDIKILPAAMYILKSVSENGYTTCSKFIKN